MCPLTGRLMILSDIDQHWAVIKPGLKRVRLKAGGDWTPHKLRKACRRTQAFLFVAPEGFVILRPDPGPVLHLWVAYGTGGGLIHKYQSFIDQLARDIGAERITIQSQRAAYRRLPGWTATGADTYERRVA